MPERNVHLETADATYYFFKGDILGGLVTYSTDRRLAANLETITAERAREVIAMNRNGEKPIALNEDSPAAPPRPIDLAEQDDLTRFDKKQKRKKRKKFVRGGHQQGGEE